MKLSRRGHLVYLFGLPLVPAFFSTIDSGSSQNMLFYGLAIAGLITATLFVRLGVGRQNQHLHNRYRPGRTHGFVWLGALITAAVSFFCLYVLSGTSLALACSLSAAAIAGIYLCYGAFKPSIELQGGIGYSADEIGGELANAEDKLHVIRQIAERLPAGDVQQRLFRITRKTNHVLQQIQSDPSDLRRARKFLSVFLPGTRDVTETYWKVYQSGSTDVFERRFRRVLAKVETIIEKQIEHLKKNEEFDLDVQMEVLQTQLDHS